MDEKLYTQTPEEAPKRCLFKLTRDALIVANTGSPFSRQGVISICSAHLSEKGKVPPIDNYSRIDDTGLVESIAKRKLGFYRQDINLIRQDFGSEDELQRDYGGRSAWELLQNADDANAPENSTSSELIGAKGIGFKSVLEITDEPEIHSGTFHFLFSPQKTSERLREFDTNPPQLTFQIPHCAQASVEIEKLQMDGFITVVRLPFRDATARDKTSQWLKQWMSPEGATVVLLCPYIKELTLDIRETSVTWRTLKRPPQFDDGKILIECDRGGTRTPLAFHRWAHSWKMEGAGKKLSVAAVLHLTSEGKPEPFEKPVPLHVFFPTKETAFVKTLLHASFELEQSRKHVRTSEHEEAILNQLTILVERLVRAVPAQVTLRALMPSAEAPPDSVASQIQKRIIQSLQTIDFVPCIGGRKRPVGVAKLYEPYFGAVLYPDAPELSSEGLTAPSLVEDEICCKALKELGAPALPPQDYPRLLRFCRNRSLAKCKDAVAVLIRVVDQFAPSKYPPAERSAFCVACRTVPCWWLRDGHARDLAVGPPLLRPPLKEELPPWISVDVLADEFAENLTHLEQNRLLRQSSNDPWKEVYDEHLFQATSKTLLESVLVSAIHDKSSEQWWAEHGCDVLSMFAKWYYAKEQFADIDPMPLSTGEPSTDYRTRLAAALRLPTGKGWIPACQCYAGSAWGGPASFDDFFDKIQERGVLLPSEKWHSLFNLDHDKWKQMLRWVGVSWEPKLLHYQSSDGIAFHRSPTNPFSAHEWTYWESYCDGLNPGDFDRRGSFHRNPKLTEQWALEYFPQCVAKNVDETTLPLMRPLTRLVKSEAASMCYRYDGRGDNQEAGYVESLAHYQLHHHKWLPAKPSVIFPESISAPDETYMPHKSLCGLLPEITVTIKDDQGGRDLASFLVQDLKINDGPPKPEDHRWRKWVEELPDALSEPNKADGHKRAIRDLYKRILAFSECPRWMQNNPLPKIACETWNTEKERGEIRFLPLREVYYIDEPHLAAARRELLHYFSLFLLELDEGRHAVDWLGLRKLSAVVTIEPLWGEESDASQLIEKYERRKPALRTVLQKELPLSDQICLVHGLQIVISQNGDEITRTPVDTWDKAPNVLIEAESGFRGLALALSKIDPKRKLADLMENILRARDDKEVKQRLRDFGIPEEAINEAVVSALPLQAPPEQVGQPHQPESRSAEQTDPVRVGPVAPTSTFGDNAALGQQMLGARQATEATSMADLTEKGRRAENWLRNQIKRHLGAICSVSDGPVRDEHNRETDILVTIANYQIHIEVKSVEGSTVFWSDLEVSKAHDCHDNYYMALVRPVESVEEYSVNWLWAPLTELLNRQRSGVWLWGVSRQPVQLESRDWTCPNFPPSRQAERFSFQIYVSTDFIESLPKGLTQLEQRVRSCK